MNHAKQLEQLEKKIRQEKNNTLKHIYLRQLADASREEGRLEYSILLYEEALKVAQQMHDSERECETLIDLGSTADDLDKTKDAIAYYQQALKIAQSTRNFPMQSRIHAKLSALFAEAGDQRQATENFTQAIATKDIARGNSVVITEKEIPANAIATQNERAGENPPQIPSFAEVSMRINQRHRTQVAKLILFLSVSALCLFALFSILKEILSLSPIYLFASAVIISLLGAFYYIFYRFR